ncbi:MAG: sulfoxide reductase heme-binding subunit YedZ [Chloroflexaceae bacterium]|nr:sulfoxide reductase heme-binding subunit YedZ [Chloroflexaceae bacterium]
MRRLQPWLERVTHVAALVPLAMLIWLASQNQLGPDPVDTLTLRTGKAALNLLVLSLACTPISIITGFKGVLPLRRTLGLYAFLYASLHLLTFLVLDYGLNFGQIIQGITEQPYVIAGLASFSILFLLAITSTRGWMRRLGKYWKRLHQYVYLAALLAVLHYFWLIKAEPYEPLIYGGVVVVLLVVRWSPIRRRMSELHIQRRTRSRRTDSPSARDAADTPEDRP